MSETRHVRLERDEELAVVTIDRPEKLNALNADVMRELSEIFESLDADAAVRAIILTGAGGRAFVAGADIGELTGLDPVGGVRLSREGQRVFGRVERCTKPVIAAVSGWALGGGCELALACHLRIASTSARFGLPEVGLGIIPGYGGTVRLTRAVGLAHATEMILTGESIDAERAHAIGLVSAVVEVDELLDQAKKLARRVTKNGPLAVRMALQVIRHAADAGSDEALALESSLFGLLASTEDMKEGVKAFLEKRKPRFRGA